MVTFHGAVAQMIFPVVAALRAVAKALWRVGDCEVRVVHFPKEFGVSPACHRARPHLPANARWQAGRGSCGGAGRPEAPLHRSARKPI
jgi:hypothetical protein